MRSLYSWWLHLLREWIRGRSRFGDQASDLLQGRTKLPVGQQLPVDVLQPLLEQGVGDEHLPVFGGQLRSSQEHHLRHLGRAGQHLCISAPW